MELYYREVDELLYELSMTGEVPMCLGFHETSFHLNLGCFGPWDLRASFRLRTCFFWRRRRGRNCSDLNSGTWGTASPTKKLMNHLAPSADFGQQHVFGSTRHGNGGKIAGVCLFAGCFFFFSLSRFVYRHQRKPLGLRGCVKIHPVRTEASLEETQSICEEWPICSGAPGEVGTWRW